MAASRHAYMIVAHRDHEQLERLIDRLDQGGGAEVFVHVDAKNDDLHARAVARHAGMPNVHFVEHRVSVNRGGFSQVAATLRLMDLVCEVGRGCGWASLLSAQDYPIKSARHIQAFLERHRGRQFLEWGDIGPNYWRLKCFNFFGEHPGNRRLHVRVLDNLLRRPQKLFVRRRNLRGLALYKGSSWFTLSMECLEHVVRYVREHPEYVAGYRYSYCADESFFHTIVLNGPFRGQVINDDLTFIDWQQAELGSPKVLTVEDLDRLIASDDLFARKFDLSRDRAVLARLDEALAMETPPGPARPGDWLPPGSGGGDPRSRRTS